MIPVAQKPLPDQSNILSDSLVSQPFIYNEDESKKEEESYEQMEPRARRASTKIERLPTQVNPKEEENDSVTDIQRVENAEIKPQEPAE